MVFRVKVTPFFTYNYEFDVKADTRFPIEMESLRQRNEIDKRTFHNHNEKSFPLF